MNVINNFKFGFTRTIIAIALVNTACATTMKEKIVRNTLIGGAIGAAIGSTYQNYPGTHELMFGGTAAALAALGSVYYYDPDKEIEEYHKRSIELARSMENFANGASSSQGRPISSGTALNNVQALPEKYRKLISQGEWALKQIDEWEQIDENRKVHKTEILELIPPTFNQN